MTNYILIIILWTTANGYQVTGKSYPSESDCNEAKFEAMGTTICINDGAYNEHLDFRY